MIDIGTQWLEPSKTPLTPGYVIKLQTWKSMNRLKTGVGSYKADINK